MAQEQKLHTAVDERSKRPEFARYKGPSIQDLLDEEVVAVPWTMRQDEFAFLGNEDLPTERYTSKEFFELEVERLWPKVWQLACLEQDIPNVGDTIVYDIVDWSFVVVRVEPDRIRAFYNSCLHRGRKLGTNTERARCVRSFRCPYHAMAWNLDGSLHEIPASIAWDFAHVEPDRFALPEVRVETWDGFVFVNMDHDAEPLMEFLGDLPRHFERWPFANRWKAAHVAKVLHSNWKVAQEAFIESYHVIATHPQMNAGLLGGDGSDCEYDIYDGGGANFNRMILAPPMPNPNLPYEITEQELIDEMLLRGGVQTEAGYEASGEAPEPAEGTTARKLMAEMARDSGRGYGYVGGPPTEVELTSAIQYFVFPNIFPWSGPIFYRFRPDGHDVDRCIMECMFLVPLPEGAELPPAVPVHWLGEDDSWTEAPELGMLAEIFDQDTANIPHVQTGLKAAGRPGCVLATYGDSRLRHYHQILDRYLSR